MQKIIFFILVIIASILFGLNISYADLVIPGADVIRNVSITSSSIGDGSQVGINEVQTFSGSIFSIARIVISGFALIYIVLIGARMILHSEDDTEIAKQKQQIFYTLFAFIFLNIPDLVYRVFMSNDRESINANTDWTKADINSDSSFWNSGNDAFGLGGFLSNVVDFLKVFAFIAAIISFVWGAYQLILSRGKDDYKENAQNRIVYGVIGLLFLGILEAWTFAVRQSNIQQYVGDIAGSVFGIAFFFAAPVAVFFLILGAYYYITSGGDEDRAKKGKNIFIYTFIATIILLAGSSFLQELIGLFANKK